MRGVVGYDYAMPKINWHGIGAVLSVSGVAIAQSDQMPASWKGPLSVALCLIAAILIDPSSIGSPMFIKDIAATWGIGAFTGANSVPMDTAATDQGPISGSAYRPITNGIQDLTPGVPPVGGTNIHPS